MSRRLGDRLDPKKETTFWCMAKFQGLDYRARTKREGLGQILVQTQEENDPDAMAQAMAALGDHYVAVADQVDRLDTTDVDKDASADTRRFAHAYRELGQAHAEAAAQERNVGRLKTMNRDLAQLKERVVAIHSEREALFETLSNRYGGRDFNTVDHH